MSVAPSSSVCGAFSVPLGAPGRVGLLLQVRWHTATRRAASCLASAVYTERIAG